MRLPVRSPRNLARARFASTRSGPAWWTQKELIRPASPRATCANRSKRRRRWAASGSLKTSPAPRFSSLPLTRPGSRAKPFSSRAVTARNPICSISIKQTKYKKGKHMSQYHKLYTPQDSAVVFIDHQPQMLFGVANADRAGLINNVTLLAKCAKEFNVPAVLTAVETQGFSGYVWPMLLDVFL